ncbi:hypothetical protein [Pedobacter sp. Leaf176]|uniref:hypothetical protein n=1 Tax=Pedobacter sp. Leaf176 TaxID=1736286 RepID=UPI0006F9B090|nr:hypothetical protein [Pedobacter sp. Leaf176]KQR70260.1 hypothetical protein ASF92_09695 [Pedobacter sp. Leaf176]
MAGVKQETLIPALGISQQAISKSEQNEEIEDSTLEKVGKVLRVTTEAINYWDEALFHIISKYISYQQ